MNKIYFAAIVIERYLNKFANKLSTPIYRAFLEGHFEARVRTYLCPLSTHIGPLMTTRHCGNQNRFKNCVEAWLCPLPRLWPCVLFLLVMKLILTKGDLHGVLL